MQVTMTREQVGEALVAYLGQMFAQPVQLADYRISRGGEVRLELSFTPQESSSAPASTTPPREVPVSADGSAHEIEIGNVEAGSGTRLRRKA